MNARTWLAGFVATFAMFLWLMVVHSIPSIGQVGEEKLPNEAPLLAAMQANLPAHGTFVFPARDPKLDMAGNINKIETGPSGVLVYHPTLHYNFGRTLLIEFLTEFALVMLALWVLTLTRVSTFAGRIGIFALIGLAVACGTNIPYWNWYGFSTTYTVASIVVLWSSYIIAGIVAATFKVGGAKVC